MEFSSLFIVAPLMVAAVVAFPIVRYAMNKKTKQFAFRFGLPFYIVGGILLAVMDPSWAPPILVPIISFLMGLGFGGAQMMPWIIFADTVDVAEFATGERPTASYSGMMTLVRKVAGALSVGMIGWILTPIGYITDENATEYIVQSPKVLLAIRLLMGILIASLIAISLFSSFKFRVNNKKLERMRYFIDLNREGKLDEITEEEKAERDALVKELYGNKVTTRIYTKEEAEAMKRAEAEQVDFLDKDSNEDDNSDENIQEETLEDGVVDTLDEEE
jgi:Na+/melibiose symporter-like transporter